MQSDAPCCRVPHLQLHFQYRISIVCFAGCHVLNHELAFSFALAQLLRSLLQSLYGTAVVRSTSG